MRSGRWAASPMPTCGEDCYSAPDHCRSGGFRIAPLRQPGRGPGGLAGAIGRRSGGVRSGGPQGIGGAGRCLDHPRRYRRQDRSEHGRTAVKPARGTDGRRQGVPDQGARHGLAIHLRHFRRQEIPTGGLRPSTCLSRRTANRHGCSPSPCPCPSSPGS